MNTLGLVLKNLRGRMLSTWLTVLSVALGCGLAVAVLTVQRGSERLLTQGDFGYDVVVGPAGSRMELVLVSSFGLGGASRSITWGAVDELRESPDVVWAVPAATGDTLDGFPILATTTQAIGGPLEVRPGEPITLAEGRAYEPDRFEAVLGSRVAASLGLGVGDTFQPSHGTVEDDAHDETWEIVGVAAQTGTAFDSFAYIPLASFFAIGDHGAGLREQAAARDGDERDHAGHDHHDHAHGELYHLHDGRIELLVPRADWRVTQVYVKARDGVRAAQLAWRAENAGLGGEAASAAFPGVEAGNLFGRVLRVPGLLLLGVAALVCVVAAVGVLVSLYNATVARRGEVAVLRALGATRGRVLTLLVAEGLLVGVAGALLGLVGGKLLALVGDAAARRTLGRGIDVWAVGPTEGLVVAGVVLLAALAALVPGLAAYRVSVAEHLDV